jgi:4-hydroxy-tetrahydrodipicolinate synthase
MSYAFKGVIPPVVTPFTKDDKISDEGLRSVIRYVMKNGCDGVFVCGSQGEFFSLSFEERVSVFEIAVDESKKQYPVLAGTAAVTTSESVKIAQAAERAGCDAISVATPYFVTVSADELYTHYAAIAASIHIPMMLYNNPDRTHNVIPAGVVSRLAQIDNIIGMKDSSGDLTYDNAVIDNTPGDFSVFCGKDTVIFNVLMSGGAGAVPASGNVAPRHCVEIYRRFIDGDLEGARRAQQALVPLRNAFGLGSFPVVMKEALNLMGFDVGTSRLPIQPVSPANREILKGVLADMNLL